MKIVMKDIFLKLMLQTQKYYMEWKKRRTEKVEQLVTNLHGKKELVLQARNSEQALYQRLVLKKYH